MSVIVEKRGSRSSVVAGFTAALALHGLALLSFVAFEQPATSSADTGEGGLVVIMGDAGGVTAQTVADNIQAAEASGAPDGESVEEVVEQTVAVPSPDVPVAEVIEATPVPVVPEETVVEPVETAEAEPVVAEQVETTEAVTVPQEAVEAEAAEIVPVETVTTAIQPPPVPVTRPTPPRPVKQVKPVETEVAEVKPDAVAPTQPKAEDVVVADKVQEAQSKQGSGTFDTASSAPNVAAGPGQTQASSGGGGAAGARKSYFASIQSWLERHKRYPRAARLRRYEGTVSFSFQIDRSGSIMTRSIVKSSGKKVLDEALLDLLKRADPLPPMPPEISGASFHFTTSIEYSLR